MPRKPARGRSRGVDKMAHPAKEVKEQPGSCHPSVLG